MMRKAFILLPVIVWILFCLVEWYWWVNPPYGYFFPRGAGRAEVTYTAVTQGDLVAENIFVTPVQRKCRYITDAYGSRNATMPAEIDMMLMGDSFAYGAGNSHEDTPAVQLERLTGKKVRVLPRYYKNFDRFGPMGQSALLLQDEMPMHSDTLIYFIVDVDLLERPFAYDPAAEVEGIAKGELHLADYSPMETFVRFKKMIKDYSPQAIMARKIKSYLKVELALAAQKAGYFERSDSGLEYLDKDRKVYAFRPFSRSIASFSVTDDKFRQVVNGLEELGRFAREKNKNFMVVIIPRKEMAYRKYFDESDPIMGYGPGETLAKTLEQKGIDTLLLHPVLFKAVEEEMEEGKQFVYWSDDTHWGPYGINLAMQEVKRKLVEIGAL